MWNASFKLTLSACVVSICCVGFSSLGVVYDELNDCAWNLGMYQLSDKCVKSFAHIECYSDCLRRGAIWLTPFAMVLFNVCSAVTIECCVLYPCCVDGFGMFSVI